MLLTGCTTTVPVVGKFPAAPQFASEGCADLQKLANGATLSDVSNTININYTAYYDCVVRTESWRNWYAVQKKIFEGLK